MGKYTFGVLLLALSVAAIVGYNVNIVSGIASLFAVYGLALIITGMMESVIKAVFVAIRNLK